MTVIEMSELTDEVVTIPEFPWLPPWPENVDVHEVVHHFLLNNPLGRGLSDAETRAYFLGFQRAFDAASTDGLVGDGAWHWYRDMRRAIAEGVSGDDGEHATA